MILETLAQLQSTFALGNQSLARQQRAVLDVEQNLTPLEFHRVVSDLSNRFANAHAALQSLHLFQLLANEPPTLYVRRPVAPDVTLFHDPNVNYANKCLIIAFCGRAQRLMMPTGVFLQLLPSTDCDVVVLKDPGRNHFLHGSREYAADFFQLVTRLEKDLKLDRYKNVFCYGTSMGGFVALRCGLLLGTSPYRSAAAFLGKSDDCSSRRVW